jgi:hypothetical protein
MRVCRECRKNIECPPCESDRVGVWDGRRAELEVANGVSGHEGFYGRKEIGLLTERRQLSVA